MSPIKEQELLITNDDPKNLTALTAVRMALKRAGGCKTSEFQVHGIIIQ